MHPTPLSQPLSPKVRSWLGIIGLLAFPTAARGQVVAGRIPETEAASTDRQARCSEIVGPLLSDTAASVSADYYGAVGLCEQTGPDAIARLWRTTAGGDPAQLRRLTWSSRAVRDARILSALLDVVQDGSRPTPVARAAVDVLIGYAVPSAALVPLDTPSTQIRRSSEAVAVAVDGAQPLGADVFDVIYSTMWHVAFSAAPAMSRSPASRALGRATAPGAGRTRRVPPAPSRGLSRDGAPARRSSDVGGYARLAGQALDNVDEARLMEAGPAALSLAYVCGNQFRLQSTHPRSLRMGLTYDVEGSGLPAAEIGVPEYGTTVFTAPAAGTVRLLYLGEVITTAANAGQACPDGSGPASARARLTRARGHVPTARRAPASAPPDRAGRP